MQDALLAPDTGSMLVVLAATVLVMCLVVKLVSSHGQRADERAGRQREYDAAGSSRIGSNAEIPRDQSDRDECKGVAHWRDNSKVTGMRPRCYLSSHDAALEYCQDGREHQSHDIERAVMRKSASHHATPDGREHQSYDIERAVMRKSASHHNMSDATTDSREHGSYDTERRGGSAGRKKSALHHRQSDAQRTAMASFVDGDTFQRLHGKRSSSASEGLCDMDHGKGLGTTGSRLRKSVSFSCDLEGEAGSWAEISLGGIVSALRQVPQSIHSHAELQVEKAKYGHFWWGPVYGALDAPPPGKARTLSWLAMKERHLVLDKVGRGQMTARDAAKFPFLSLAEEGCGGSPSGSPNKSEAYALAAHDNGVRMVSVHEN